MQIFLPYSDFGKSLESLDNKRLGKQRVEVYQIISAISGRPRKDGKPYKGWVSHPCTIMWRDHLEALKIYYNWSLDIWKERGFKNTMEYEVISDEVKLPEWLGFEPFHSSHRANLLRKDIGFYSKEGWTEDPNDPYIWFDDKGRWYKHFVSEKKKVFLRDQSVIESAF
jgi:hypothetical protein